MIKELIQIANELDKKDRRKEADYLDAVMRKYRLMKESHKTNLNKEMDWKEFVINNLFKLEGTDHEDPEELWQEEDSFIAEHFDGIMENAEMESGISCPISLSKNLLNALDEIGKKDSAPLSEAEKGLASFLKQYLSWNLKE